MSWHLKISANYANFPGRARRKDCRAFGLVNTALAAALFAAIIEATDYLDCAMVKRDGCEEKYQQKEQKRRQNTKDVLDLD